MTHKDLSLVANFDGTAMLHRPDCPEVEKARREERPILTMFDCQRVPEIDIPQCACLVQQ